MGIFGRACVVLAACAPAIDGPLDHQRAIDREDAVHLGAQLAALPGAVRAEVTLHRPVVDAFTHETTPASAAILVVVDDRADRAAITDAARRLAHATAPEIPAPEIAVELGAIRPQLAAVGPFAVETRSRTRLVVTLAGGLAVIFLLAAWIAYRERGSNAQ